MFSLFNNDLFNNFWSNKEGDIFLEPTCRVLKFDLGNVDLIFYMGLEQAPVDYEFGENKELKVFKKVITQVEQESVNEQGETVVNVVDVESLELDKVYAPIMYFNKGIVVRPC